jgi:hypothetical protein
MSIFLKNISHFFLEKSQFGMIFGERERERERERLTLGQPLSKSLFCYITANLLTGKGAVFCINK